MTPTRSRTAARRVSVSVALVAALLAPLATGAEADPGERILRPGQTLGPDQSLFSSNGAFTLRMQSDGNLVEYSATGDVLWATHTMDSKNRNSILRMQDDGNAVVIAPGNRPVWATGTSGNPGSTLELQDDGNLVVYAPGHRAIWANGIVRTPAPAKPAVNPAPAKPFYVAMGDSFSSGEGVPPFDKGTDTSKNSCHRSAGAWARLLAKEINVPIHPYGHIACSGAVTDNVLKTGQHNELAQIDHLEQIPGSKFITITIGGNDIEFAGTVGACYAPLGTSCGEAIRKSMKHIDDELPTKLAAVYDGIHNRSQGQKLIVVGYPNLMTTTSKNWWRCRSWLFESDRVGLVALGERLDTAIETSVRAARDRGINIEYVSTLDAFEDYELCTGKSWVRSVTIANGKLKPYSAHPLREGQEAMRDYVADAIRRMGLAG